MWLSTFFREARIKEVIVLHSLVMFNLFRALLSASSPSVIVHQARKRPQVEETRQKDARRPRTCESSNDIDINLSGMSTQTPAFSIRWYISPERSILFADGNKNKRWRAGDPADQEKAYDGYKKTHAFTVIVFCDLFGRFIHVEISKGQRVTETCTKIQKFTRPDAFLSNGQHGMADMGFGGDGDLVVPYKANESKEWLCRRDHHNNIRTQRMLNEWGIGYISNRYRIFWSMSIL